MPTPSPQVGMIGHAPQVVVRPTEKALYTDLWTRQEYRSVSPGEACVEEFLRQARPKKGASVIDLGCGTGRAGLLLAVLGGLDVTLLDFASNCLDDDIRAMLATQAHTLRFIEADLTKPLPVAAEYGFCVDTLEHIPLAQVDAVLDHCLRACQHVFFQIATGADACGALVGHALHLTQRPCGWWLQKFRDRDCAVHWSEIVGSHCRFYVTAWVDGQAVSDIGVLNAPEPQILANVKHNIAQGWLRVEPHPTNDVEVMILGGGPSMAQCEEEIRQKRADGVKLLTINNSYNWCLDRGIIPSALLIVDARPFNARFSRRVIEDCKYFIASQCDPSVFEGLPKDRTYIWHTSAEAIRDVLDAQYDVWWGIPGGCTALLRAIPLFRMLGFRKFILYGVDSCLIGAQHHAYVQNENDAEATISVIVNAPKGGGRIFQCHPWMIAQAQEFMNLIKVFGDEVEIACYGDGLLAHILTTGAVLEDEKGANA